eukprot:12605897-Alexandrium_andersonii.AAC.1
MLGRRLNRRVVDWERDASNAINEKGAARVLEAMGPQEGTTTRPTARRLRKPCAGAGPAGLALPWPRSG